jgi:hypothetical protein
MTRAGDVTRIRLSGLHAMRKLCGFTAQPEFISACERSHSRATLAKSAAVSCTDGDHEHAGRGLDSHRLCSALVADALRFDHARSSRHGTP